MRILIAIDWHLMVLRHLVWIMPALRSLVIALNYQKYLQL